MAFRPDKKDAKIKITIEDLKTQFEDLHDQARAFMVYYRFMKTKERAQKLMTLTSSFGRLSQNIELFKSQPMSNPATKFAYEVFRQSHQSFMPRWKKFVDMLMGLSPD
jgi:hypothetical protein